jgi:hypothetical protein
LPPGASEGVEETMAGLRLRSAAPLAAVATCSNDSVHADRVIDYDPHDTVDGRGEYYGRAPYYHSRAKAAAGAANDYDNYPPCGCRPCPPCN